MHDCSSHLLEHCLAEGLILLDCKLYVHDDGALYEGPRGRVAHRLKVLVKRAQHLREREERSETSVTTAWGPGWHTKKTHLRLSIRVGEEEELVDERGQLVRVELAQAAEEL